jgi:hypothetical protein
MISVLAPATEATESRSLAAHIEERLLVPTYASQWAPASIAAHRGMALPFQITGRLHRWPVVFAGKQLQLVGIGRKKLLEPFYTKLFGDLPVPTREARRPLWDPKPLAAILADVVMAEVHRWMAARFQRAGWIILPEAVRWEGELDQVPPTAPNKSLRDDLRKVRNNGFTLAAGSTSQDWKEFYSEMVEPQARSRHGARAWLPSRRLMDEIAAAGRLHFISKDGIRVAGACSVSQGDKLWVPLIGIRNGDPLLLRQGAGNAALALTFDWARAQGYRQVDAGRTSSFLNDGIQQTKRKWGLSPRPDPLSHVVAMRPRTEAARQAFAAEPVLIEHGEELRVYAGRSV